MSSHRRHSDVDDSESDNEFDDRRRDRESREEGELPQETEQSRLFRQLNKRLDDMQQNQALQGDPMCDLVGKLEGGEDFQYEWKKHGLKMQFNVANKVMKRCQLASVAIKARQYDRAHEFLEEGIDLLAERIKHLKIADQSPNGWETVSQ